MHEKQHVTFNASITKRFKNMPYLEGSKLLTDLVIICPKILCPSNTKL
jgi:hypothetical protein